MDHLKKLKISFKDNSLNEFHIHNEIDLAIKEKHKVWVEMDLRPPPSSDIPVFNQIMFGRCYHESVKKFRSLFPNTNQPLILDLGAYTGASAAYFSCQFPKSTILCVEPEPKNYALLESNVSNNRLNNVYHVNAAVWDKNTFVEPDTMFRDGKEWSCVFKEQSDGTIPAFDMPTLMSSRNIEIIDFLKMDVEGAEQMLIGNSDCAQQYLPKVRFIATEIHPEFLTPRDTKTILEQFGFEVILGDDISYAWNTRLVL